MSSTVGERGQITIEKAIREKLGVFPCTYQAEFSRR
jgi:bifunctional DNA-binding transcriptional regulator/antitoxin component of YhaV-PrlF toxin-antitoxin module